MLNANPTAAHHLMASLAPTIHRMISGLKNLQNGSSKGISTLLLASNMSILQTCEDAVLAVVEEQYLPTVPVSVRAEIVYNSTA